MKALRRLVLAAALAAPAIGRAQVKQPMLEDLAHRAAIYLFPVHEMYRTRWNATVNEKNPARQKLNRLLHVPMLATPRSRGVTTPNVDTLYSSAWLDLSLEPVFLTVPDMGGRYYSFAFMSLFTDNFAYVCRRLDGNLPRPRMIVGPAWKGDADRDVVLVRAPTNGVWLLGRILIDGPPDQETVWTLQSRTLLESPDMRNERRILETQELMRQRSTAPPEPVADWAPVNPSDPFDLFEVGMRALGEVHSASATRRRWRSSLRCGCGPAASSTFAGSTRASARPSSAALPARATTSGPRLRRPARRSTAGAIPAGISAISATTISTGRRSPSPRSPRWNPPRRPI